MRESREEDGRGVSNCRIGDVPRYVELLRDLCARSAWDPEHFRAYRCQVPFPMYGSEAHLIFDLPRAP